MNDTGGRREHVKKNFIQILSIALTASAIFSGSSVVWAADKTIRVGVRDDIMNMSYKNETTGKYYGMEIDLARALAQELGYTDAEFVTVTPDTRKDMLLNGDIDCIIAAYSISDSRLENFDFSPAYYEDDTEILVEKSTLFTELSDLKDMTIGILNGSNAGPLLGTALFENGIISDEVISNTDTETQYDHATVLKYESYDEIDTALEDGSIDAACMDGIICRTYLDSYLDEDRQVLEGVNLGSQEYGVATQKDSELSGKMSDAVSKFLDDGTIAALIDKWD